MSLRKTLLAGVLFLALLGLYLLDAHRLEQAQTRKEESERLFTFALEDIQKVELHNENGEFMIERRAGGDWWLDQPLETRADKDQVEAMLQNLQGAKKRNAFTPGGDLAQYGLERPAVRVAVTGTKDGGTRTVEILFGDTAAQTYQVYGGIEGEDEVFTLSDYSKTQCQKTLLNLRDKTIVAAPPDTITRVDIQREGQTLTLTRPDTSTQGWTLGENGPAADPEAVETLLRTLHNTRATKIYDPPTSPPAALDLTTDRARALLTIVSAEKEANTEPQKTQGTQGTSETESAAAGGESTTVLIVGKTAPEGGEVYVLVEGDPRLFRVRDTLLAELSKTPNDLRDRRLLDLPAADLSAIQIRAGDRAVEITRPSGDADWSFADGAPPPVAQDKADRLLAGLTDLKAKIFIADATDVTSEQREAWGLDDPAVEVRVRAFDRPTTAGFDRGEVDPDRGIVYVRRLADGAVLGLDFKRVGDFNKFRPDLEDRTFVQFERDQVDRIRIDLRLSQGPVTYEFNRRASSWGAKTSDGHRVTLQPFDVTSFLDELSGLEYADSFTPAADDTTRGGLDESRVRIALLDTDGEERAWLALGGQRGLRQIMESGQGAYLVNLTNTDRLTRGLQTLLTRVEQSPPEGLLGKEDSESVPDNRPPASPAQP